MRTAKKSLQSVQTAFIEHFVKNNEAMQEPSSKDVKKIRMQQSDHRPVPWS